MRKSILLVVTFLFVLMSSSVYAGDGKGKGKKSDKPVTTASNTNTTKGQSDGPNNDNNARDTSGREDIPWEGSNSGNQHDPKGKNDNDPRLRVYQHQFRASAFAGAFF